jgi:hypothetical protein
MADDHGERFRQHDDWLRPCYSSADYEERGAQARGTPLASRAQEIAMEHQRSGRLHWDTTHAATPGWLLFLDGQPGDAPTMLPGIETSLPRDASHAEIVRLIGEMLSRETGHPPQQVHITPLEEGSGYAFVATDEDPA